MIKQRWLAYISVVLLAVAVGYVINRLIFLSTAVSTTGQVTEITSYNGRCGGGKRRRSYNCTKYHAQVLFRTIESNTVSLRLSAGSSRGHNQPTSYARYAVGENVPVIYNPKKPSEAYENTIFGVWGTPLMVFVFQIVTFFSSFMEPRRRYS